MIFFCWNENNFKTISNITCRKALQADALSVVVTHSVPSVAKLAREIPQKERQVVDLKNDYHSDAVTNLNNFHFD